jgi:hypothetical protein
MNVISFVFFNFLLLVDCNPYLTRNINLLQNYAKGDSIYVTYPIIECRLLKIIITKSMKLFDLPTL